MDNSVEVGTRRVIQINRSEIIGSGRFCKVYPGVYDTQKVAVKRIPRERGNFEKEAIESRQLRHPNIVHYHFFDFDNDFEYLVMEKCHCSLESCLVGSSNIENYDELKVMYDMALGVHYLHEKNIIHRNIHPSNVLLTIESQSVVRAKISDFGIVKHSVDGSSVSYSGSTGICYDNPEQLRKERVGKKSDVFALGLCFHAVLSGNKSPFGVDEVAIAIAIRRGDSPDLSSIRGKHTQSLILKMLSPSKNDRPSIQEVLNHFLFWDDDRAILFFQRVSDHLNRLHRGDSLMDTVSSRSTEAIGSPRWQYTILHAYRYNPQLKSAFNEHFECDPGAIKVMGLLRRIRNFAHHIEELKPVALRRDVFGNSQRNMIRIMMGIFPNLLPVIYEAFKVKSSAEDFKIFYHRDPTSI